MNSETTRLAIYRLLSPAENSTLPDLAVNLLIIVLVLLNLFAMALTTEATLAANYANLLFYLESFSVAFFTVEYLLRIWSSTVAEHCSSRIRYIFSADSVIDLLAILPFYALLFLDMDLRVFIAFRLFRLFKLFRYFSPLAVLANVLQAEARSFLAAILVMMVLVFIGATGIYFFEAEAQPDKLGSIPQAMWWSIVSLTTLGYGDVVPLTIGGRIFAGAITLFAIGIVAMPAGMLASRFSEELNKRKNVFSEMVDSLLDDGKLSDDDQKLIELQRQSLCLSNHDAQLLTKKAIEARINAPKSETASNYCSNCGHAVK